MLTPEKEIERLMADYAELHRKYCIAKEAIEYLRRDKWACNQELKYNDCTIGDVIERTLKQIGDEK